MTENQFYKYVVEKAISFGMKPKNDPHSTSKITKENGNAIIRHNTSEKAFFAFIDKSEETSGRYNGLSFVVLPNSVGDNNVTHCVMSIGIGSSTLGNDTVLACNPGFRRSFMKLIKGEDCQFFFAENWGDMESRTPGLKEAVENTQQEALMTSVNSYDDDPNNGREGLLPAACLLTFDEEFDPKNGIPVLDAWLAQYARWRVWDSTVKARENVDNAIEIARAKEKDNKALMNDIKNLLDLPVNIGKSGGNSHLKSKYIVLQGAPGCGKTRMALEIAKLFDEKYVTFTQFHAETTYSDFVYGIKPILGGQSNNELGYRGEKGVLLEAIDKAEKANKDNNKKSLLIIDEINRANLSNVLGPVFYLFEANAQDHNYKLNLGMIEIDGKQEKIEIDKLPDNLIVVATMNTADRSLAVVDFALRRRFVWYTLYPHPLSEEDLPKNGYYFDKKRYNEFNDIFEKYATDDELNLQPGHSYFILRNKPADTEEITEEMRYRLLYELMPLIKEYFNEGYLLNAKEEFCNLFFKYTKEYMFK